MEDLILSCTRIKYDPYYHITVFLSMIDQENNKYTLNLKLMSQQHFKKLIIG